MDEEAPTVKQTNTKTHTLPKVAEDLGISVRQVYRLVDDGELVKVTVGKRSARITDESYQAYWTRLKGAA